MLFFVLFMQLESLRPVAGAATRSWGQQISDIGIVAGAGFGVGLLALLLLVWARFLRKKPRHSRSHASSRRSQSGNAGEPSGGDEQDEGSTSSRKHRRRRAMRRDHRPRNPTLADTGGLPPARTGDGALE